MAALKPASANPAATITLTIQSASLSARQLLARAREALSRQQGVTVVSTKTAKAPEAKTAATDAAVILDRLGARAKTVKRRVPQREIDAAVARVRAEHYANGHHAPE